MSPLVRRGDEQEWPQNRGKMQRQKHGQHHASGDSTQLWFPRLAQSRLRLHFSSGNTDGVTAMFLGQHWALHRQCS